MTTVRTIKLKRGGATAPEAEPVAEPMTMDTAAPPAAVPAQDPVPVPQPTVSRATASRKSYMVYVIAAALTVAGFITILSLQYFEIDFYKAEPCSWAGGGK